MHWFGVAEGFFSMSSDAVFDEATLALRIRAGSYNSSELWRRIDLKKAHEYLAQFALLLDLETAGFAAHIAVDRGKPTGVRR